MTLKEFFRKARRGRTWFIGANGRVVSWDPTPPTNPSSCLHCCPLGAVMPTSTPFPSPGDAAEQIGINIRWTRRIVAAADSPRSKYRKWLLKNLGVRV